MMIPDSRILNIDIRIINHEPSIMNLDSLSNILGTSKLVLNCSIISCFLTAVKINFGDIRKDRNEKK